MKVPVLVLAPVVLSACASSPAAYVRSATPADQQSADSADCTRTIAQSTSAWPRLGRHSIPSSAFHQPRPVRLRFGADRASGAVPSHSPPSLHDW